jgi:hypothetical protein
MENVTGKVNPVLDLEPHCPNHDLESYAAIMMDVGVTFVSPTPKRFYPSRKISRNDMWQIMTAAGWVQSKIRWYEWTKVYRGIQWFTVFGGPNMDDLYYSIWSPLLPFKDRHPKYRVGEYPGKLFYGKYDLLLLLGHMV